MSEPIVWRVGGARLGLFGAVHGVAGAAAVDVARIWPWAWMLCGIVVASAAIDAWRWTRDRAASATLSLVPDGIVIGAIEYRVRRAWLGPGATAVWLRGADRRRRMIFVVRGETDAAAYAALRRHVNGLKFA